MGKKLWIATENVHEESAHYEQYDLQDALNDETLVASPAEMVEDANSTLQMASESFKTAFERLSIVQGIRDSLNTKNVCSQAYMTSLENYRPVLEQIIGGLGVRRSIPCTEDFINEHRAKSAHLIATEGLGEFLKETWKKIKEFFALFFKKVSLYFKRILKANLELEHYEAYLRPMMAKLRSGAKSALPTDLAAFESKLPSFLADEGMQSMDTEYLMNYGVQKIGNLLTLMEHIGFNGVGSLNAPEGLPMLQRKIEEFVNRYSDLMRYDTHDFVKDSEDLLAFVNNLISGVFAHPVNNPKELPESVYSGVTDAFTRAEMGEDFGIRSLVPNNAGSMGLPKDANVFLAGGGTSKSVFVEGYISQNTYVRNMIAPPASFKSLQGLYDFYESRIKKIKVQDADKALDKTNDLIVKLLDTLSKRYAPLAERISSMRQKGTSAKDVAEALIAAQKQGRPLHELCTDVLDKLFGDRTADVVTDADYQSAWQDFLSTEPRDSEDYRRVFVSVHAEKLDALFNRYGSSLKEFAQHLNAMGMYQLQLSPQEADLVREGLQQANQIFTVLFTRLQSILRFIMSNIYGVYTELRYEYVRYLYLSAQRYRLT